MKCYIMNKNTPVLLIEYNEKYNSIEKVYEVYNIEYAPLSVINAYYDNSKSLSKSVDKWFKGRGIPSWRKDLEGLLSRLNVSTTEELLDKAYGLSLSDQYWMKEENSTLEWENINFFENDFKYKGYLMASLSSSSVTLNQAELMSPNNTTDGMLQKGWIIENGRRVLVKGTYQASREEPINEWLASEICERLGFEHCKYTIDIIGDNIVSKCANFITKDEEIIPAKDIFYYHNKPNNISDYEHYINILEEKNVPNARENIENMFILDCLIMNTDRHLGNFGIIRNVNTLEWIRTTPIFDNGESMQCEKLTTNINFSNGVGKFFTNTEKKYGDILKIIGNGVIRIDIEKLNGLVDMYKNELYKYQAYTDISDLRIEKLCEGLEARIGMLGKQIRGRKYVC